MAAASSESSDRLKADIDARDLTSKLRDVELEEAPQRVAIDVDEVAEWRALFRESMLSVRAVKGKEAKRLQLESKQKTVDDKNKIIDHFTAMKGARYGAVSFLVIRAENIGGVLSGAMLHTNSFCVVTYGDHFQAESEIVPRDECPEYRFNTYFSVPNDKRPIIVTIMERPISKRLGPGIIIGTCAVNLRGEYPNLVRSAPDGVYTEKGSLILPLYYNGKKRDGMSVTVEWSLELRDANRIVTCEDCGRVETRCTCSDEEKAARRELDAKEAQERVNAEMQAKNLRLLQEEEVSDRAEIIASYNYEATILGHDMRIDADRIRREARERALAARGLAAGAVGGAAVAGGAAASTDAPSRPANEKVVVDIYANDDVNIRGNTAPVQDEGKPEQKQETSCCIVA